MRIIEKQSLIVIKEPSDRVTVNNQLEVMLRFHKFYTFLWFKEGLFCIIPREIILNAIDILDTWAKGNLKTMPPQLYFTWDQGIPVDPKVGYALLGE